MKPFFRGISRKLKVHIEDISGHFGHAGEQGSSNEKILIELLTNYLPKRYAIGRGKIVSYNEEDTNQQDVIIYDPYLNSPLYTEDGFLIAGIESVYGVIEVKTTLNKSELENANNKAKSVITKHLLPSSIIKRGPAVITTQTGSTLPPIAICFAFRSDTSIDSIKDNLLELENLNSNYLHLVGILDQGVIYKNEDTWNTVRDDENALLYFLIYLIEYLGLVPDRQFKLVNYL